MVHCPNTAARALRIGAVARQRYEEALPIYRDIGARLGEANTILDIGYIQRDQEEYDESPGLQLARRIGSPLVSSIEASLDELATDN
ncbi:MAG TPA: hypothetical protein VF177_09275 [Anaerolineae bacterium]